MALEKTLRSLKKEFAYQHVFYKNLILLL